MGFLASPGNKKLAKKPYNETWNLLAPPGPAGQRSVPWLRPEQEPSVRQLLWLSKSKYFSTLAGSGHTCLSVRRQLPIIGFKSLYKMVFLEDLKMILHIWLPVFASVWLEAHFSSHKLLIVLGRLSVFVAQCNLMLLLQMFLLQIQWFLK